MTLKTFYRTVAAFAICIFSFTTLSAQNYNTAVGARLGYPLSLSYKHFVNSKNAVEVFGGFRGYKNYSWVSVSGAYQIHNNFPDLNGLKWYYGAGASVYFYSFDNGFGGDSGNTSIGINGYLGLDYKFADVPFSLTVDWIPTFFVNGFSSGFGSGFGSLGVRYVVK